MKHLGCKVRGCKDEHRSKGFCSNHYQKHRRKVRSEFDFLCDTEFLDHPTNANQEATMKNKEKGSQSGSTYTGEEVRAIHVAMDKVRKNPGPGVKIDPYNQAFFDESATVLRHDSKGLWNRTGGGLKTWHSERKREQLKSDAKPGGPLTENYTQIGHEVQGMRDDISEILTEMAGIREFRESVVASVDDIRQTLRDICDLLTAGR